MPQITHYTEFIDKMDSGIPMVDARSEAEYEGGHIPGSVNLPLLNNEQRKIIGTVYKHEGKEAAVSKGFELVGPLFHEKFSYLQSIAPRKKILIYCWRGGMRSGVLAWMMGLAGYEVYTLKGGYQAYRNWVLSLLAQPFPFYILGGKTGTGKTECLLRLRDYGEQIIDLEQIASHKGSTFGHISMPPQPTSEQFENIMAAQLNRMDTRKRIWVENESRMIGKTKIPDPIFNQFSKAPLFRLMIPEAERRHRLLNEYGGLDTEELAEATRKLEKRIGNLRMRTALEALRNKDLEVWLDNLLPYYDQTYQYELLKREGRNLAVPFEWYKVEQSIQQLLNDADKVWKTDSPK